MEERETIRGFVSPHNFSDASPCLCCFPSFLCSSFNFLVNDDFCFTLNSIVSIKIERGSAGALETIDREREHVVASDQTVAKRIHLKFSLLSFRLDVTQQCSQTKTVLPLRFSLL